MFKTCIHHHHEISCAPDYNIGVWLSIGLHPVLYIVSSFIMNNMECQNASIYNLYRGTIGPTVSRVQMKVSGIMDNHYH